MKLLVVTGIFPPDHGGPASYVPAVTSALARMHEVLAVVTLSDSTQADDGVFPFPVIRIARKRNRLVRWIWTVWMIRRLARQADVVYLNGLVLEGVIACKLFSCRRVVVKVVGDLIWEKARNASATESTIDAFQSQRHSLKWDLLRRLQSWYTRKADLVIVPSRYLASIVEGWGVVKSNIAVIYNAVEMNATGTVKEEWDLITVARLVPWKNVDTLIRLSASHSWRLKIVGDGPLKNSLEALVDQLGARNDIQFTGHVDKNSVAKHIRSARAFVLNSSYEGLPHIVLEAKAAGVPVIATSVGGTVETINDGVDGYLVPDGDEQALAAVINRLMSDQELRERIGRSGQESVRDQFSFSTMVSETEHWLVNTSATTQKQSPVCDER